LFLSLSQFTSSWSCLYRKFNTMDQIATMQKPVGNCYTFEQLSIVWYGFSFNG
jgi:hypothetical protein